MLPTGWTGVTKSCAELDVHAVGDAHMYRISVTRNFCKITKRMCDMARCRALLNVKDLCWQWQSNPGVSWLTSLVDLSRVAP